MLDSQQKRKVNKFIYHKWTIIFLFIIVIFFIHSTWVVYKKKIESDNLKNISLNYKNNLKERENDLDYKMQILNTDKGKETEIRSKFSVAKDKENIVVIVDDSSTTENFSKNKGIWQKILDFLGI